MDVPRKEIDEGNKEIWVCYTPVGDNEFEDFNSIVDELEDTYNNPREQ